MALTPLPEALAQLFARLPQAPDTELLPLEQCLSRVLAQPVLAAMDVPPFDNSAMDGYAVRIADLPGEVPVSQRIPAGAKPQPLIEGTVARIFTGAMLPPGADAVVMQEDAIAAHGRVQILGCLTAGQHIRRRGADIAAGSTVLSPGRVLTPQDLGVIASVGVARLPVRRRLRVAVISTGDELVAPGADRADWQIYNSNGVQLAAQLRSLGMEPVLLDTLPDDPQAIGDALEQVASTVDCIVTSGGVSVGEEDHVRNQIAARGELALWKLAIKPGKPLAFGSVLGCPVFGLPGNPVSSWTTFGLVVKPWLLRAQGAKVPAMQRLRCRAGFTVARAGTREEYLRVTLSADAEPVAALTGDQSSGVLSGTTRADALAIIPVGATVAPGDAIDAVLMSEFLSPGAAG